MADVQGSLEIKTYTLPSFTFQDGTQSSSTSIQLAYADINPTATKVALIPTCFRGRISTTLTFCQSALKSHRIIIVALFGNGESTSPSNSTSGKFPAELSYIDVVRAQHELLTNGLGVQEVDVAVGFSMGGQTAYHWAVMYPTFIANAVIICSSARTSPHNYQFLEGPKYALLHSSDYPSIWAEEKDGNGDKKASRGIQAFGKSYSAWLTSAQWFDQRLWEQQGFKSLEEWNEAVTEIGYRGWHPDDLLAKLGMWQRGDITSIHGDTNLGDALGRIEARVLLMPCETDQYFRPDANEREVRSIRRGEVDVIPSVWGHIAGGGACEADKQWMDERIGKFLGEA